MIFLMAFNYIIENYEKRFFKLKAARIRLLAYTKLPFELNNS